MSSVSFNSLPKASIPFQKLQKISRNRDLSRTYRQKKGLKFDIAMFDRFGPAKGGATGAGAGGASRGATAVDTAMSSGLSDPASGGRGSM